MPVAATIKAVNIKNDTTGTNKLEMSGTSTVTATNNITNTGIISMSDPSTVTAAKNINNTGTFSILNKSIVEGKNQITNAGIINVGNTQLTSLLLPSNANYAKATIISNKITNSKIINCYNDLLFEFFDSNVKKNASLIFNGSNLKDIKAINVSNTAALTFGITGSGTAIVQTEADSIEELNFSCTNSKLTNIKNINARNNAILNFTRSNVEILGKLSTSSSSVVNVAGGDIYDEKATIANLGSITLDADATDSTTYPTTIGKNKKIANFTNQGRLQVNSGETFVKGFNNLNAAANFCITAGSVTLDTLKNNLGRIVLTGGSLKIDSFNAHSGDLTISIGTVTIGDLTNFTGSLNLNSGILNAVSITKSAGTINLAAAATSIAASINYR